MFSISLLSRISRAPDMALRVLAVVNTLFFASFLLVLSLAAGQAKAEEIVCTGQDLTQSLPPKAMETARAEAAKTPNGEHRLWKIEKDGIAPSFLFGTMHMTDPRVIDLTPEARKAYDDAATVIIETTDVLDEKKSATMLLSRPDLMMFTDQTTLTSLIPADQLKTVEDGLTKRGLPLITVNKMKPWMILGVLALPACELKRKQGGAPFLDIKLAHDAQSAGKDIAGLETMIEQMDAMAKVPMDFHIQGLIETVALGDAVEDVMETMITLYTKGQIAMIMPVLKQLQPEGSMADGGYAEFEEIMINTRNALMAERAREHLSKGNRFIAVGALHLPGEKGLVELLRKDGYTLTPLAN